ncbi:MAG: hypothetical protein V4543_11315 [Bacteroidota bacterium]
MKTVVISILLLCTFALLTSGNLSCYGQGPDYKKKTIALKAAYKLATGKDSIRYESAFFNEFPADFKTFNAIYGYDESSGAMPLYD